MFILGTELILRWAISIEKGENTYFLKQISNQYKRLIWTQQRKYAIDYDSSEDATSIVDKIKDTRDNKKLPLRVI